MVKKKKKIINFFFLNLFYFLPLFLEERDESNVKIINDKKNNTAVKIERANFSWDNEQPILKSFFFYSKKYFLLLINFFF